MNKKFRGLIGLALAAVIVISGCGQQNGGNNANNGGNASGGEAAAGATAEIANLPAALKDKEVKVKVIRKIGGDDHTAQFLAGAKQEGEALGFKVDTFTANGDTAKFLDALEQAADSDYDGVVISHGDDPATVEAVKKLREKGKQVVAFDSNADLATVEGVTLTSQKDEALAQFALDQLVNEQGTDAKIVYLWVDGFPPMVRRNAVYQDVLAKNPGIKEVERFGVATANTSVETQNAVTAMLAKHPKGEIDAIFATWDAFATGATRALIEAGRTEIKIYGIDVSNADLQLMQEANSPWVSTAAVDPKMIGAVDLRLLAKKIAGEETPASYDLEAANIEQAKLAESAEPVNMVTLADIIPGWGQTTAFEEDWMKALKEANAK
ncbi:sugar ABC transporter substrate-binding protein [Paenibacillus methanolicus]|uniref:Simple sugar transport system substrate-binding protein n=1 Tax=Paenibacillus methanolicus TaxID=582686 RepID=A0A5S5C8H9_9BACL|nr:sugar ABC transporter substrate-binding protein [Paenibacillus methanolicus]TYP74792.1 simple sugar transport system substrate-binding protein [Paenibacillus methanolicus]